jgi:hypothetical protein
MTVTAEGADITNNVSLVGSLDPGGYYTLDANIIPMNEGPLDVKVTINYTDDFNQTRTIEKTIAVNVVAAPVMPTLRLPFVQMANQSWMVQPMRCPKPSGRRSAASSKGCLAWIAAR